MPQTDSFFLEEDIWDIADFVFSSDAFIVPDLEYATDKYVEIRSRGSLQNVFHSKQPKLLYILSNRWQSGPLVVKPAAKKDDGRKFFFISQKNGGPTIDIFYPGIYCTDDKRILAPGFVAYHSKYFNTSSGKTEAPPLFMVKFYRKIVSLLRRESRVLQMSNRSYIITAHAQASGVQLGGIGTSEEARVLMSDSRKK